MIKEKYGCENHGIQYIIEGIDSAPVRREWRIKTKFTKGA